MRACSSQQTFTRAEKEEGGRKVERSVYITCNVMCIVGNWRRAMLCGRFGIVECTCTRATISPNGNLLGFALFGYEDVYIEELLRKKERYVLMNWCIKFSRRQHFGEKRC